MLVQSLTRLAPTTERLGQIQYAAGLVLAFLIGIAVSNGLATNEALQGTRSYFIHRYCPQVAAKAAQGAAEEQKERDVWGF